MVIKHTVLKAENIYPACQTNIDDEIIALVETRGC